MKKIAIPARKETILVDAAHVICLEGDGSYTHFYIVDPKAKEGWRKITASYSLKHFERQLSRQPFTRVCKSYIVGLQHVYGIRHDHTINLQYQCCDSIALSNKFCPDLNAVLKKKGIL